MRFSHTGLMAAPAVETTLVAGTKQALARGFTLVELLVVLVILALTASVVVVTLPQGNTDARDATTKFGLLTSELSERAVLEGRSYGFSLDDGRLQLFEYGENGWVPRPLSRELRGLDEVYMTLTAADAFDYGEVDAGGELLFLGRSGEKERKASIPRPMIVFSPTGENTPFTLRVDAEGEAYTLFASSLSRMEMSHVK